MAKPASGLRSLRILVSDKELMHRLAMRKKSGLTQECISKITNTQIQANALRAFNSLSLRERM